MSEEADSPARPVPSRIWLRVGALVVLTAALVLLGKVTGVYQHLHRAEIQERLASAGLWGPALYLAVFAVGELIHIPGTLFIAAAVLAYGRGLGTPLAFVGAILSLSVTFVVVRAVGGKPLVAIRWAFVRRLLAHLEERPIRTVVALRTVLWLTPQLNYALALSSVSFRDYVIGSTLGLVVPVVAVSFAVDYFAR